jgi:hypothetical protein
MFGALTDPNSPLNFVPLDVADNWLPSPLGLGMLAAGLTLGKTTAPARRHPNRRESLISRWPDRCAGEALTRDPRAGLGAGFSPPNGEE